MQRLLSCAWITYCPNDEPVLSVARISKELVIETHQILYCIDVDYSRYRELARYGLNPERDDLITGTFLRGKACLRYDHPPYFIIYRTPDPRRTDIEEVMKAYGMKQYDQFEFMKITNGRGLDKWEVRDVPVNGICLPKRHFE